MKTKLAIAISIIALLMAGTILVVSAATKRMGRETMNLALTQGGFANRNPMSRQFIERIARELNLTQRQKTEIQAIFAAEKSKLMPLVLRAKNAQREMQEATRDGRFNEEQVRALAAKQAQTLSELLVEKERVKAKVYAILTPEQRAKAEEMRQQFKGKLRQRISENFMGE